MNTNTNTQQFTGPNANQQRIIDELCTVHGLDPSQISFDGIDDTPIFDYEAVCILSLKLTDIRDLDCSIIDRTIYQPEGESPAQVSTAKCVVTLPDGRTRSVQETAFCGEVAGGYKVETVRDADGLAQNRASRRGIRSVGINLWRAHQAFMRDGQKANGSTDINPRQTFYNEIHVLAEKIGLIIDGNRDQYEYYLAESFGGITSAKDLSDEQLVILRNSLRAMASALSRSNQQAA